MERTLIQLNNLFKEIAEKHKQIDAFFWGDFLKAQKEVQSSFPLLCVTVSTVNFTRNQASLNLIVTIADKVFKGHDNLDEVQSDTLRIAKDVLDTLQSDKWKAFSTVSDQTTLDPFIDRSVDEVTGWIMNLQITVTSIKDLCAIPFADYDFGSVYQAVCEGVKIFQDGVLVETVASGGSFSFETSGTCEDANFELTINDIVVSDGSIPSGDTQQIPIDEFLSGECEDANYIVKYEDETLIESGTVVSGGTVTVIVPNCDDPIPCADATAVLKDTEGTIISTTDIASGTSQDIEAPDGSVLITDTALASLHSVNVTSGGSASQIIADSEITLQNSEFTQLQQVNVKATQSQLLIAPDSTAFLKNTEDDTITSVNIPSGESDTLIAPDSQATIKDSDGVTLKTESIASDKNKDIAVNDSTVNVRKSDGVLITAVSVKAEGTESTNVNDSVITLNDSASVLISTTNVKATDPATITAPDGTVTITDSASATLHSVGVKSNGSASQIISDSVAVIKDSANATLKSENIKAQGTEDITINDSTVNVNKSDSTLISAVTVKAEATTSFNVNDSVVNVNSTKLADVKATDTLNITVVDSLDASVSVTLSGGNKITIPSLPCAGGTCNDAYKLGADFYTLDRNNPFGNTNRFTAIDGTQTYTDGIVIDWLYANDYAENVIGYGVSPVTASPHATQIGNEPYTIGAFSGFTLIHSDNLWKIVNKDGTKAPANGLDYSPFNYVITGANNTRVRSGDNFYNDTASTWLYNNNGNLSVAAKTLSASTMIERQFTYTELGV